MPDLPFGMYGFSIAIYVISIMVIIAGIALALGYALNDKRLKEFGKNEISQSVINGALVGSLLVLFAQNGILTTLISSLTFQSGTSMQCMQAIASNPAICFAYNYLVGAQPYVFMGQMHQSVLNIAVGLSLLLFALNAVLGIVASIKVSLLIITLSLNQVIGPILSQLQYMLQTLSTITVGAIVQASILLVASASAVTIILPLGLILRTFYPSRKLGGLLIAIAIGLYVVFPLTYVLDAALANSFPISTNQSGIQQYTSIASQAESTMLGVGYLSSNSIGAGIIGEIQSFGSSLANGFSSLLTSLWNTVAYLILYIFILPAFSVILTVVSIRELAQVLGGDAFFELFNIL